MALCECVCVCVFGTAAAAAVARKRYELDGRRANGRTRTCSKSTQGHTLKNRDYILNLLSVRTCSRASHISYAHENRVVRIQYRLHKYQYTQPAETELTKTEQFSFFAHLSPFISLLNRFRLPLSIQKTATTKQEKKKKQRRRNKCAKVKTEIEFIRFFPFNIIRAVANTQYLRIFAYSGHFNQPLIVLFTGHRCVRDGYFGYCH